MGGLNVPSSTKVKYLAVDNLILAHAVNADESPFFCAGCCGRRLFRGGEKEEGCLRSGEHAPNFLVALRNVYSRNLL